MNIIERIKQERKRISGAVTKLSYHPDLDGRVHLYSSYADQTGAALEEYADYARVFGVYTWVHKAITKIIDNVAGLPVVVVDANDKTIDAHPLTELFANVNDTQNPIDLWGDYIIHKMLGGESFIQVVTGARNNPVELWSRRPDYVGITPDDSRKYYPSALEYVYQEHEKDEPLKLSPAEMIHDKFTNPLSPWRGLAPIAAVREGIVIDLFAQAWSKQFFRNSTRPDFAIVAPQGITESERDAYLTQFSLRHRGVAGAHLPLILEDGVTDIKTFSFPPKDIEWLQQREFSRDEVGAIFGVPDEIMGYGRDTYENFQTATEVFWTLTLLPLTKRRDVVLNTFFTRHYPGLLRTGQRIQTDTSEVSVLQEDVAPKVDMAVKFMGMGIPFNTLDERLNLGIGKVEGGDIAYIASNLVPLMPQAVVVEQGVTEAQKNGSGDILGYHIEQGVVTRNEARAELGLAPVDDSQDATLRDLRIKLEVMTIARNAGIAPASAAQLVGLNVETEERPAQLQPNDEPESVEDEQPEQVERSTEWRIEAKQFRKWLRKHPDSDAIDFVAQHLTEDDKRAILATMEEATGNGFFTRLKIWDGASIPDGDVSIKAMILQLDDSDPEAERNARMEIEAQAEEGIGKALAKQQRRIVGSVRGLEADDFPEWARANLDTPPTEDELYDALRRALLQSVDLGVSVAVSQFDNIGFGFDWTLANEDARRWANRYAGELIRGIDATTKQRVRTAVEGWITNGEPLQRLIEDLTPIFGEKRASLIASTEVTKAYAEANRISYKRAGVKFLRWNTANDERTCPICGALHDQIVGIDGSFDSALDEEIRSQFRNLRFDVPPAHPRCRCWITAEFPEVGN